MNESSTARFGRVCGAACVFALIFAGCAVGPDYHRPHTDVPPGWKSQPPWVQGQPRDAEIKQTFWDIFDDPVLTSLELEATTNSPDLLAAFERVEEARATARVSRADLFPDASFDPNANRTRYSANRVAQTGSKLLGYTANDFFLPLDLSYEIDLWGRVRRSFHAARAQAQASAADFQNAVLSLQSSLAQTYFMIRSIDLDRRVVSQSIDLRRKNLDLVESLHRGGADSAVDLAEAKTELSSAEADLVGLELQRAHLENSLAVLCGKSATGFSLPESTEIYKIPPIPIGLPADLLQRRPDVAEAERNMAAASEGIGVAKAAFFPSIQLTGSAGTESVALKDIFNWESRTWSIGPNITLPLFEGGRNRAGLQRAKAAYQEALAQYRSQVLVAFREVEDGLVGLRLLKQQYDAQMRALDGAKQSADLSRLRYKEGLASYFEVVLADRTMLDNEITAYAINGQRVVTTVQLVKALGGGWKPDNAMMTNGVTPLQKY